MNDDLVIPNKRFTIDCPRCQTTLNVVGDMRGELMICTDCRETFRVIPRVDIDDLTTLIEWMVFDPSEITAL